MRESQDRVRRRVYLVAVAGVRLPRPVTLLQFLGCYLIGVTGGYYIAMDVGAQTGVPTVLGLPLSILTGVVGGMVMDRVIVMGVLGGLTMDELQNHPARDVHAYRPLGAVVVETMESR